MKDKIIQYIILAVITILLSLILYRLFSLQKGINRLGFYIAQSINKNSHAEIKEFPVSVDDDFFIGEENVPVTIIMFSDYECSYCKVFFEKVFPQIQEEFISKGLVKLVIRDYPIERHENAFLAAQMVECAKNQGKYRTTGRNCRG